MFRLYSNEKLVHNYVHIKNYMYTRYLHLEELCVLQVV